MQGALERLESQGGRDPEVEFFEKEAVTMSMIFDEYGRPFIILREQQAQARIRGKEAQKVRNSEQHPKVDKFEKLYIFLDEKTRKLAAYKHA